MKHPLHQAVGTTIECTIRKPARLVKDEACGGCQHIPLFCGQKRSRETQLCKVDLLLVKSGEVSVIIEIEESGFNPTKICGKLLTSALATHYIHDKETVPVIPFAKHVLFVQVLDGSKISKLRASKPAQCKLIQSKINQVLPINGGGITKYRLFIVQGPGDKQGLAAVAGEVAKFASQKLAAIKAMKR